MFPVDHRMGIYPPPPGTPDDSPKWAKFDADMREARHKNERHLVLMAWMIGILYSGTLFGLVLLWLLI